MTPSERKQIVEMIDHLNEAAQAFRESREQARVALLALIEANDAHVRSIDQVIKANVIALDLFHNREAGQ